MVGTSFCGNGAVNLEINQASSVGEMKHEELNPTQQDPGQNVHRVEFPESACSPHQIEVRHWTEVERQLQANVRLFWTDHPRVGAIFRERASLDGLPWPQWVLKRLGGPARIGLELGCGSGRLLRELLAEGVLERGIGVDLDESRFDWDGGKWGDRLEFLPADANRLQLERERYDLILCQGSLHHIEDLEHVMEQVSRALTPRGLFLVEEFVGPRRFQWTEAQLSMTRKLLGLMPLNLRIYSNGVEKREEGRSTPEAVIQVCPSEAIRSDEIVPLMRQYFDVVAERPLGGTIAHLLYSGIIQNFPDDDETTDRIIDSVDGIEAALIESGALPSDFILMIGQRRKEQEQTLQSGLLGQAPEASVTGRAVDMTAEESWLAGDLTTVPPAAESGPPLLPAAEDGILAAGQETDRAAELMSLDSLRGRVRQVQADLAQVQSAIQMVAKELDGMRPGEGGSGRQLSSARLAENQQTAARLDLAARESARLDVLEAEARFGGVCRAIQLYRCESDAEMAILRSQRAWRMMVGVRKAYELWRRDGWRGKLGALGAARDALLMREVEPVFQPTLPHISQYVSAEVLDSQASEPTEERMLSMSAKVRRPLQSRHDIVILAIIDFEFRFQRPQQLAVEYAARGHRVFWISPTRFLRPESHKPYHLRELRSNLFEVQLRGLNVDLYLRSLPPEVRISYLGSLRNMYRDWSVSENLAMVQIPFYRDLALDMRRAFGTAVIYDCMDDWDSFENMGSYNREQEKLLAAEADVLLVTARRLQEKFEERGLKSVLVRNGVDYDYFHQNPKTSKLGGLPKPVAGYFGAIADWIDLDLVLQVARARPEYSFALIGEVFNRDVSELERLANVILTGSVPYEDIPSYLAEFDVCLIPFLLNEVTAATDPVKLYEYLSLGKPVVATAMGELEPLTEVLYLAKSKDDFLAKLDAAISEDCDEKRRRRMEFASHNTWASRVDAIDSAVREVFPKISIVIVTYNSERFIGPCLESVWKHASYPNYEVIAVDNASTDKTRRILEMARMSHPELRCKFLEQNSGFAAGNNIGASEAAGEFLVLLNADTLVTPGWLGRLHAHFLHSKDLGLICPTTNFAGNEAKINVPYTDQQSMEVFASWLSSEVLGVQTPIRMVPLFCGMLRREVFWKVGGLDERYGIGMFEDDDLSAALHELGLRTACAEDCFVHHFGQGSFSTLASIEYNRLFERNRRFFEEKWRTRWEPHTLRPGVRPPSAEARFEPIQFCEPVAYCSRSTRQGKKQETHSLGPPSV